MTQTLGPSSLLRPQNGDNGMGNLSRVIVYSEVKWLCRYHSLINFNNESLALYIQSQGESVDFQMSAIAVKVEELHEAEEYLKEM